MSKEFRQLIDDVAYYMDGSPLPGLGISHWRDDPIVAWFDEFCRDQFDSVRVHERRSSRASDIATWSFSLRL